MFFIVIIIFLLLQTNFLDRYIKQTERATGKTENLIIVREKGVTSQVEWEWMLAK